MDPTGAEVFEPKGSCYASFFAVGSRNLIGPAGTNDGFRMVSHLRAFLTQRGATPAARFESPFVLTPVSVLSVRMEGFETLLRGHASVCVSPCHRLSSQSLEGTGILEAFGSEGWGSMGATSPRTVGERSLNRFAPYPLQEGGTRCGGSFRTRRGPSAEGSLTCAVRLWCSKV